MQYEIDIGVNLTVRFYRCPQTLYDRKVRVFAHRNRFERSKSHWKHDRVADIRYKKIKKVMYEERKINSIWVMDYRLCRRNRNSWCVYSTLLKCTRSFFLWGKGCTILPSSLSLQSSYYRISTNKIRQSFWMNETAAIYYEYSHCEWTKDETNL
jgi:hypothetical protein